MSTPPSSLGQSTIDGRRRISLIWLIPIVAILIGAWLAWDTYSKRGPLITVQWASAQGLVAGQSRVRHKDVELGQVQSVTLTSDLASVLVSIRMNRMALPMLTSNAQFWVVTPRFFAGSLSGLGTLISGSYIEMDKGGTGGTPQRDFVGLKDPPLLQADVAGTTFLLRAARIGSISVGSPVFYRDLDVGQVLGWDLAQMAESVVIHAFVRAPFDRYVRNETRFWDASGISVKLGAGGVQLKLESVRALLLGGISFETPATGRVLSAGPVTREFPFYADQDAANRATFQRRIEMLSYFPGSVSGLAADSAVTFQGLRVGQVLSVELAYDPVTDSIRAPVRYEVEPERIAGVQVAADRGPLENARLLVQRGLRAQIKGANLLTGEMEVSLEIMADAAPAELGQEGQVIVIPAIAGGLSGITNSVTGLLAKLNRMPFDDIGRNLNDTLAGASKVANGEETTRALVSLQSALGSVQDLMRKLDADAGPALRRLPEIAAALQSSVTQANRLMGSVNAAYGDNSPVNRQISRLLLQINDTARSFKALSDLLGRHPEALIRGRSTTE